MQDLSAWKTVLPSSIIPTRKTIYSRQDEEGRRITLWTLDPTASPRFASTGLARRYPRSLS
jgi:hypothetical protein